ncbi:hypothetical protein [Ideonella sp.]|uniref:hypothetical protein n=1 Tax=Ideonella sp. TaxID=1929293 RepID=UPI0035B00C8C
MTTRPTTDYPATETRTRATAWGLAALVTLSLLAGMGGVADQQYEAACVAQNSAASVQVAAHPTLSHPTV